MPLVIASRIGETTATTGTGAYTVGGAINASYKTFASRMAVSDYCYAMVEAVDTNGNPTGDWEEGMYTYSAANTLTRSEIHASSNGDAPVNWGVGIKRIYIAWTAKLARSLLPGSIGTQTPTTPPPGGGGTTPSPTEPKPVGPNAALYGSLLFRDEFDGSTLDSSKWNDVIWYRPANEVAAPKNYNVSGSCLNIWPLADGSGRFNNRTIDTDGKYYQKYGFFEMRAKLCRGRGTWPAFWLFAHPGGLRPEIDIMEAYAGGPFDWGSGAPNYLPYDWAFTFHDRNVQKIGEGKMRQYGFPAIDLSAAFHTYGMHWDSTGFQMYFDGQAMGPKWNITEYNDFDMYLMLDLWYGSESGDPNDGGDTPPQGISNSYSIDYVRTWSLLSGGGSTTPSPSPGGGSVIINYYGDSTVWGYKSSVGTQVANPVPKVVQSSFPNYTIRNKGYNSVSSKEIMEDSGDMVNFPGEGGWNDQMRLVDCTHVLFNFGLEDATEGRPMGDYTYYITQMVLQARNWGRKPILVTPSPSSSFNVAPYVQAMKDVAVAQNCPIIDVHSWALGYMASNGISQATFTPDGTHPSDQAYIDIGNYVASQLPSKL